MNVEELKARLRALLHQRDSLPLSRWIGLRDDALESLHLWWLLFSGHGLKDDKMFWSLWAPLLVVWCRILEMCGFSVKFDYIPLIISHKTR